ncbi:4Fe-4S cluster-binding domain-containing protein, partial [Enterococcus faecalis]|nr:4Fe-4S cluster-binding domain-containing protein [Enterococcus faecalis]
MRRKSMQNQVYLINSDQEQFNIFFHPETSRMMRVSKELSVDQMTNEQIDELLKQFKKENSSDVAVEKVPGRGTVALTFMSARTCNLGCTYCFAGEGEYGSVSDKPAFFTKENYMNAVRFALENYSDGIKSMCFFGGEPMINFREIKSFVKEAQDFFKKNDM